MYSLRCVTFPCHFYLSMPFFFIYSNLFRLLNLISSLNLSSLHDSAKLKKKITATAAKVWEIITLLPTNRVYYELIESDPEQYLFKLTEQISLKNDQFFSKQTNDQVSLIVSLQFLYQLL